MTEIKYIPVTFEDNTSGDPMDPNGTRITAARLDHMQLQHRRASGVQVLDELPHSPEEGENLAVLSSDGRLYFYDGFGWRKVVLE
jgi:hypothetical protein